MIAQTRRGSAGRRNCRPCLLGAKEEEEEEIEADSFDSPQEKRIKVDTKVVYNVCCVHHVTARTCGSEKAIARAWEEPEIEADSFTV